MSVRRLDPVQPEHFEFTPENERWAKEEIAKYPEGRQNSAVIALLWRAQHQHGGWLPEPAIRAVAEMLGMARIRVLEIATFYTMFNLSPVGQYYVQLCGTTPCWLRGSDELKEVCRRVIGPPDTVTEDGLFSWTEVECLAACVNAPMVQINADYYEDLTAERLEQILMDLKAGKKVKPGPQVERQYSAPVGGPTTLLETGSPSRRKSAAAQKQKKAAPKKGDPKPRTTSASKAEQVRQPRPAGQKKTVPPREK